MSQESKILSDFLLAPASLRDFMSLRQFTDIFPKGHRSNPAVEELYRELYHLREKDVDVVRRDIAEEIKRSKQLRREYARERRKTDEAGLDPIALRMEEDLSSDRRKKLHTLQSVHSGIEEACQNLETQIAEMEEENQKVLSEVQEVVSALSDLRHGRFAQSVSGEDIREEVLATLGRLEAACAHPAG